MDSNHNYSDGAPQYPSAAWPAILESHDPVAFREACVPPTPPRPTAFPRTDWSTAVWTPPDLSCAFVTAPSSSWVGKFASDAVKDALDGRRSWGDVGSHGIILALADLMLQCRDVLRDIHCAEAVGSGTPGYPRHRTFEGWHDEYRREAERIIAIVSTLGVEGSLVTHHATGAQIWQRADRRRADLCPLVRGRSSLTPKRCESASRRRLQASAPALTPSARPRPT
jgi:hypothetical protein